MVGRLGWFIREGVMAVLLVLVGWWGWTWLQEYETYEAVKIMAAHDVPENGLPIFAQFVVTQELRVEEPFEATKLVIPVYWPKDSEWLQIDLWRNEKLVQRWRQHPKETNMVEEVELRIDPPLWLDGSLEVEFNGSHILHENHDRAPRIFIEKEDANFPNGNYRIAENKKEGDIGLLLGAQKQHTTAVMEKWEKRPEAFVSPVAGIIAGILLIFSLPRALAKAQCETNDDAINSCPKKQRKD